MTQSTTQITAKRFFRQDTKPNSAPDGATWVTESDGSGNDTVSRYQYDATADIWELNSAVGPSEPNAGTNVPGATWRDTASASAKQYDGSDFQGLNPLSVYESGKFILAPGDTKRVSGTGNKQDTFIPATNSSGGGEPSTIVTRFDNGDIVFENTGSDFASNIAYTVFKVEI